MANYRRIMVGRRSLRRWALVDPEDYERLAAMTWSAGISGRHVTAITKRGHGSVSMHRLVMGLLADDPRRIEHINDNTLDNRRANLRFYEPVGKPETPVEMRPRPEGIVIKVGGTRPRRYGSPSLVMWARVDAGDVADLSMHNWSVRVRNGGKADAITRLPREAGGYDVQAMHRMIMGLAPGDARVVDHINGDPLDNRRANLRIATKSENGQNRHRRSGRSSRFRGVCYAPGNGQRWPWLINLRFPTEDAANEWVSRYRREYMPFSEMDKEEGDG